jgi:hypothetical protein
MPYSDGKAFVDENAGVGYVALSIADLVAESTGDVPKIDSLERDNEFDSGNVGIGTASPTAKLQVVGSAN